VRRLALVSLPAAFTVLTAWAGFDGNWPGMLAAGLLAALWWTVLVLAAWVRPRRKWQAEWTPEENAALYDSAWLKKVLAATPRQREGER
jgi:hypothetical protein